MSSNEEIDIGGAVSIMKTIGILIIALVVISMLLGATYTVQDGEQAVVTRFGAVHSTAGPGFHFKAPFIDAVHRYEVRTQAYTMSSSVGEGENANRDDSIEALTEEGLNVNVDMTVRYQIDPGEVDYIYSNVAPTQRLLTERIVRPTARESIRSCSAQYPVEGIYSDERDDFADCVTGDVADDFERHGLMVETVQIRNIMLPSKVRQAIQDKQTAQERIEQKQKELEIEELEKQRKVIEAGGIAESNKIIGRSLSPAYLRWYWIQEGLEKGDAMYVPIGQNGLPIYKDVDSIDQSDSMVTTPEEPTGSVNATATPTPTPSEG